MIDHSFMNSQLGYVTLKIRSRLHYHAFDWLSFVYKPEARGNLSWSSVKIEIFVQKGKNRLRVILHQLFICISKKHDVIRTPLVRVSLS